MNFETNMTHHTQMKQAFDQNNNEVDTNGASHHSNVNAKTNR